MGIQQTLLKTLIGCGTKYFEGNSVEDMLNNLKNNEEYSGQSSRETIIKKIDALTELIEIVKRQGKELREGDGFESADQIYEDFKWLADEKQEMFYSVMLDNRNRVIGKTLITKGILNQTLVHPREVFAPAIENRAASIVILHNHPSGGIEASAPDRAITKRLQEAGEIIGIQVLDHIIIGDGYKSFSDDDEL